MRKPRLKSKRHRPCKNGGQRLCARISLAILGTLLCFVTYAVNAEPTKTKNVLVLYTVNPPKENLEVLESTIRAHVPERINFYVASLENPRDDQRSYLDSLAETLSNAYAGTKLDLVIACSDPAIKFAVQYRSKMFPGTPIVFTAITAGELEGGKIWPNVTGLTVPVGMRETIDLALHLHPDAKTVAVIGGGPSALGEYWLSIAHAELLRHRDKVREIDITGPPSREMIEIIDAFPAHTVALFQLGQAESNQPAIGSDDVLRAAVQRLPTYSAWLGLCLDHGCVGGAFEYPEREIVSTGEIAARVLTGERPEDIPIVHNADLQVRVDWRALQRWRIPMSALPPGSLILYRPPTFWERDRKYIFSGIGVIFAQAFLIVGLLWQRRRKQKAEAVLRESEERFRLMADTTPSLIWMCDGAGYVTYLNARRLAFTDPAPGVGYGDTWTDYIHTDDLKNVLDSLSRALKHQCSFSMEYRLRRGDGVYRWMFDVASPRVNGDGSFAGFIGSAIDVTGQKLAQQALEKMGGQLIEAQEKERSRIARDLHDDICQRLVILSMEIEDANRASSASAPGAGGTLVELRKHCSEIVGDLRSLSHELHSPALDYLGIVAALRGLCQEVSKQHRVSIAFKDNGVPPHISKDVSLCLFRVAQEALHNAAKYSGAKEFKVEISGAAAEIELMVSDKGIGFDVNEAKRKGGLGFMSMQERVNLHGGNLRIESKRGVGSRIVAVVPIVLEDENLLEAVSGVETAHVVQ